MNPAQPPPLLPADRSRHRVLTVARIDGWGVAGFAAACGLAALVQLQWLSLGWCGLALACGAMELHGRHRLLRHDPTGTAWLVGSQVFLLVVIWAYLWFRWRHFDPDAAWAQLPGFAQQKLTGDMRAAGLDPEYDRSALLYLMNRIVCVIVAAVTLIYQGGLGLYYAIKARVAKA